MTTIELLGVVLGGGTVSAVVGSITTALAGKRAERTEAKRSDASVVVASIEADGKTEASLADVMRDILTDMRTERVQLVAAARAEEARLEASLADREAKHLDCQRLVGELGGRVDQMVERIADCETKHEAAELEIAKFKRSVAHELAKRPASNPGFPAVKE